MQRHVGQPRLGSRSLQHLEYRFPISCSRSLEHTGTRRDIPFVAASDDVHAFQGKPFSCVHCSFGACGLVPGTTDIIAQDHWTI